MSISLNIMWLELRVRLIESGGILDLIRTQ